MATGAKSKRGYTKLPEEETLISSQYSTSESQWNSFALTTSSLNNAIPEPGGVQTWNNYSLELRSRSGGPSASKKQLDAELDPDSTNWVERIVEDGDSLQKLALQYSTSISELKRLNGLISEQDFYALPVIRIPINRYSQTAAEIKSALAGDLKHPNHISAEVDSPLEYATSDTSDLIALSDTEVTFPEIKEPATYNPLSNHLRIEREISQHVENKPPPPIVEVTLSGTAEKVPTCEAQETYAKFIQNVDQSLEKAKNAQQALFQQHNRHQEIFNATNGVSDAAWQQHGQNRVGFWERNIGHYIIVLLCIFLVILVPLGFLLYKLFG